MRDELQWKFTDDEEKFLKKTQQIEAQARFCQISPDKNEKCWKMGFNFRVTPNFMQKILKQIKSEKNFDIEVKVDKTSFNCQMLILQSYSNFFLNRSRHEKVIELNEKKVSAEIFFKIYRWMISSSKFLDRESLIEMMSAAEYLQIEKLLKQCWEIVKQVEWFQEKEAFLLYLDAKEKKIEKVQTLMRQQVKKYFLTIVSARDFVEMEFNEVANWLRMDTLGVNCEVEIFFAAARWLLYDWNGRQNHLLELMQLVRFPLIETWKLFQFKQNQSSEKLSKILENRELEKLIYKFINYSAYREYFKDEFTEHFCNFLVRFKYKRVFQRDLIEDPFWIQNYKKVPYNYEDFLFYLNFIRSNVKNHWKKIAFDDSKKIFENQEKCSKIFQINK